MLKNIQNKDDQTKVEILNNLLSKKNIDPKYFNDLVLLLDDKDSHVRFFALDVLVSKLPKVLEENSEKILPKLIDLLADDSCLDRAIWAIKITGDKSISYLLHRLETANEKLIIGILCALGANHSSRNHLRLVLTKLVQFLKHKNYYIQYWAFHSIFVLTEYKILAKESIDFDIEELKLKVKPVLKKILEGDTDEDSFTMKSRKEYNIRYRRVFE